MSKFDNVYDSYNHRMRTDQCSGTITAHGNTGLFNCGTYWVIEDMTNNKIKIRQNTKQGWIEMDSGGVANMRLREPTRGRVQGDGWIAPTVMAGEPSTMKIERNGNAHMLNKYRIRKLTEKECFRLMGVRDEDYSKIENELSKTAKYKLAGNSIVVNCLMALFSQLNIQDIPSWNKCLEKRDKK